MLCTTRVNRYESRTNYRIKLKTIARKLGKARESSYIGRNIKINRKTMAEELNNEFDTQVRVQKAFVEATAKKVENHQGLNDNEIKHLCPVAFKSTMTNSEIQKLGLSKHYSFVPTMNVVNDLRTLGYEVTDAVQVKARKKSTNGYQKHMITLEHPKYKVEGSEEYP